MRRRITFWQLHLQTKHLVRERTNASELDDRSFILWYVPFDLCPHFCVSGEHIGVPHNFVIFDEADKLIL